MDGRFSIIRKGYCPEEVDKYLDMVKDYLEKLEAKQKNHQLEVESLNRTITELKQKEASINNAIVNSQISADSILLNARNAAENIVKNAKNEAEIAKEAINRLLSDIVISIYPHRKLMQSFRNDYEELLSHYLKDIDEHQFGKLNERFEALEKYIGELTGNE